MPPTTATTEPPVDTVESPEEADTAVQVEDTEEAQEMIDSLRSDLAVFRKHDEDMRAIANECDELRDEYLDYKQKASAAKKSLDDRYEDLRKLAAERPSFGPLFEGERNSEQRVGNPPPKSETVDVEAWRSIPVEKLSEHGAEPKHVAKLGKLDPPIRTVGDLTDHIQRVTSDGWSNWWQNLKGIGETAAQQIDDDGSPFSYIVARQDAKWYVSDSDAELLPGEDADGLTFDSAEQAQAWCEGRELTLRAEAEHEDPRDRLLTGLISEPVVAALAVYLDGQSTDADVAVDMLTVGHLLDAFDTELEAVEALAEHGAMNAQVAQAWARIRAFNVNGE